MYNFVYSITTEEIALYSNNNNNDNNNNDDNNNNNNNNNSAPPYPPPPPPPPTPYPKNACYGPAVVESSVAQGFTDRRKVMTPANEEIILTMVNLYGLR